MLTALFVSALLSGPVIVQAGSVHPFIQGESLPALLVGALQPESRRPLPGTLYPGIGSWARNQPRASEAGCCALETPPALEGVYTTEAVGSLGRVGNPFEVPVGMRGEGQMAGSATGSRSRTPKALAMGDGNGRRTVRAWVSVGTRSCQSAHEGAYDTPLPIVRTLGAPCTRDADAESDGLPFITSAVENSSTQEEQGKPDYILRTGAVFLSALTVAEIEVTRAVIERGGRELNALYKPFEKHPGALGLVNGAVTGGLGLVALELNRRGKKTEARVFVWAMVAVKAVVFTHNVRELRKTGRNR